MLSNEIVLTLILVVSFAMFLYLTIRDRMRKREKERVHLSIKKFSDKMAIEYLRLASCGVCLVALSNRAKMPNETVQHYLIAKAELCEFPTSSPHLLRDEFNTQQKTAFESVVVGAKVSTDDFAHRIPSCTDERQHNEITDIWDDLDVFLWELAEKNNKEMTNE
jgi:ribonucleotide reductase beta subunit family protein with ferritin-like domain